MDMQHPNKLTCFVGLKLKHRRRRRNIAKQKPSHNEDISPSDKQLHNEHLDVSQPRLLKSAANKIDFLLNFKVNKDFALGSLQSDEESDNLSSCSASDEMDRLPIGIAADQLWVRRLSDSGGVTPARLNKCPPKPPRTDRWKIFTCHNEECNKSELLLGGWQIAFKSCQYCFTHFCSTQCQNDAWEKHINTYCYFGRIYKDLKLCWGLFESNDYINTELSLLYWQNILYIGRGYITVIFQSPINLQKFIRTKKFSKFDERPCYRSQMELYIQRGFTDLEQQNIDNLIDEADLSSEIVVNIIIVLERCIPVSPAPRITGPYLVQSKRVSLGSNNTANSGLMEALGIILINRKVRLMLESARKERRKTI